MPMFLGSQGHAILPCTGSPFENLLECFSHSFKKAIASQNAFQSCSLNSIQLTARPNQLDFHQVEMCCFHVFLRTRLFIMASLNAALLKTIAWKEEKRPFLFYCVHTRVCACLCACVRVCTCVCVCVRACAFGVRYILTFIDSIYCSVDQRLC